MVLYQSGNPLGDPMRVITIYLAQMLVCLWDAYLAYCILKRDRKRLNFIFAGFYLFGVIGNIFNFIYGPIPIVEVVLILNFLTNFFLYFSPIFFVVFELMLLKSEKYINTKKQLLILIGYGILMFCMIFFVITPDWGVYINPKWQPVWSLPIFLYVIIGESIFAVGPVLYLSYRAYYKFEDDLLKKKWKNFIYGFCAFMIFLYTIAISNFLNDPNVRIGAMSIGIICAIVGGYLMYIGVMRQLEK
ncbi:MAG: hypothetical protein ACW98X_20895 [Promethearchaeota archaeon]|jgi:hypothetical protein